MSVQAIPGESSKFARGLLIFETTITDTKGLLHVSEFAIAMMDAVSNILVELPISAAEFAKQLKAGVRILCIVNLVSLFKWWVCEERKSWQHTAYKVTCTANEIFNTVMFLENIKVLELSKIAINIGRVPVIGLAVGLLGGAGAVFSLWHYGKQIKALNAEKDRKISLVNTLGAKEQADLVNLELRKSKAQIAIVSDIASLAFTILSLVGLCTGVGILAMNSWLMLVLGLVVAGVGLYHVMHDKANPEIPVPAPT